jgi:hypothetical protein
MTLKAFEKEEGLEEEVLFQSVEISDGSLNGGLAATKSVRGSPTDRTRTGTGAPLSSQGRSQSSDTRLRTGEVNSGNSVLRSRFRSAAGTAVSAGCCTVESQYSRRVLSSTTLDSESELESGDKSYDSSSDTSPNTALPFPLVSGGRPADEVDGLS